jgi:hypothetical protein
VFQQYTSLKHKRSCFIRYTPLSSISKTPYETYHFKKALMVIFYPIVIIDGDGETEANAEQEDEMTDPGKTKHGSAI